MTKHTIVAPDSSESDTTSTNKYTNLIEYLSSEQERLKRKSYESYWLRYLFRRIPLFFGAGLIFYTACLAMSLLKVIGLDSVNSFLHSLNASLDESIVPVLRSITLSLGSILSSLLHWLNTHPGSHVTSLIRDFITKDANSYHIFVASALLMYIMYIIIHLKCDFFHGCITKAITKTLLLSSSTSVFFITINSKAPLIIGFIVFSIITVLGILTERMLGFTRRSERYQLFSDRAKALIFLFTRRRDFNIKFQESYLTEIFQFQEELQLSKYNDTVADSHYLLTLVEKLKAPSK